VKDSQSGIKRWKWILGLCLMFGLGILTGTSLDRPFPTFLTVGNNLAASGNVTARVTSTQAMTITTLTLPVVHPSLMIEVDPPAQSGMRLPQIETRVILPPMWANDEVRGIRKRLRG
jgi:hypothetical protein